MDAGITIFTIAYVAILIVPGTIFKRFYFLGAFSKQFNLGLFADRIITSLFCGILVQIISLLTFSRIINISYSDFKAKMLLSYSSIQSNKLPDLSFGQVFNLFFYAIYSVVLAGILGFLFYKFVRFFKLDLRLPPFKFANHWHYYFKGEILKTSDFKNANRGKVISTEVDVMTKDNDGRSNLFSGLLTQYTLNTSNELQTIYLTGTTRYSQSNNAVKNIPGDIFIIPYETIQNLNIRYNFSTKPPKEIIKYIALILMGSVLLFAFYYPWATNLLVWQKILGTLLTFISWLILTTLVMSFFKTSNNAQPLTIGAKLTLFLFLFVMLFFCKLLFNWSI